LPHADLAILVPSRGRPENLARLIDAVHKTARGRTHVIAGVDPDDPRLDDYEVALKGHALLPGDRIIVGAARCNLVQWTNHLAAKYLGQYRFFASLGDDMVPRTPGWDVKLMGAIDEDFSGTGIAYPWDDVRDDIPEAYVVSANLVEALGWMMMPKLKHWWNDNVWADLGHGAGCIRQLRGVVVQHLNAGMGRAAVDQTAIEAGKGIPEDQAAYNAWFKDGRAADVQTVLNTRLAAVAKATRAYGVTSGTSR